MYYLPQNSFNTLPTTLRKTEEHTNHETLCNTKTGLGNNCTNVLMYEVHIYKKKAKQIKRQILFEMIKQSANFCQPE